MQNEEKDKAPGNNFEAIVDNNLAFLEHRGQYGLASC